MMPPRLAHTPKKVIVAAKVRRMNAGNSSGGVAHEITHIEPAMSRVKKGGGILSSNACILKDMMIFCTKTAINRPRVSKRKATVCECGDAPAFHDASLDNAIDHESDGGARRFTTAGLQAYANYLIADA